MAFRNSFPRSFVRLSCLLGISALILSGCDKLKSDPGTQTNSANGHIIWHSASEKLELTVEIGKLVQTGPDSAGTFHFADSIVVTAKDRNGKLLAHFRSREGQTTAPFELVTFRDFLWECEDSSQIEGSDLFWHNTAQPGIEVEGELQVVTKTGLITGEYLLGDMLMRHYEIGKVFTAVRWDELAGGRDGFEHGD